MNESAACSDEADPGRKGEKESWRAHVENRFQLRFTRADRRRALSLALLDSGHEGAFGAAGQAPVLSMFAALRSHGGYDPEKPHSKHMESLCVHSGGVPKTATTASMACEWRPDGTVLLWFTGTSYPCLSLYKPILLSNGEFMPLCDASDASGNACGLFAEGSREAYKRWSAQHAWIRRHSKPFAGIALSSDPAFIASRDVAQTELAMIAERAATEVAHGADRRMLDVLRREVGAIVAGWEKDQGLRR
ncbi:MAG: hypothetical protein WBH97_01545 [Rectinemataceae bacterium]